MLYSKYFVSVIGRIGNFVVVPDLIFGLYPFNLSSLCRVSCFHHKVIDSSYIRWTVRFHVFLLVSFCFHLLDAKDQPISEYKLVGVRSKTWSFYKCQCQRIFSNEKEINSLPGLKNTSINPRSLLHLDNFVAWQKVQSNKLHTHNN